MSQKSWKVYAKVFDIKLVESLAHCKQWFKSYTCCCLSDITTSLNSSKIIVGF